MIFAYNLPVSHGDKEWGQWLVGPFDFSDARATVVRSYVLPVIPVALVLLPESGVIAWDTARFVAVIVTALLFAPTAWYLMALGSRLLRLCLLVAGGAMALLGIAIVLWSVLGPSAAAKAEFFKSASYYMGNGTLALAGAALLLGWIRIPFRLSAARSESHLPGDGGSTS